MRIRVADPGRPGRSGRPPPQRLAVLSSAFGMLGPFGAACMWITGIVLATGATLLALGLSAGEWRMMGRIAGRGGRYSVAGGREAAQLLGRGAGGLGKISARLVHLSPAVARFMTAPKPPPATTVVRDTKRPSPQPQAASVPDAAPVEPPPANAPPPAGPAAVSPPRIKAAAAAARRPVVQEPLPLAEEGWQFPPMSLLKPAPTRASTGPSADALQANARLLETVLADYGVQGTIVEIRPGPCRDPLRTRARRPAFAAPASSVSPTTWPVPCRSSPCGSPPCQAAT